MLRSPPCVSDSYAREGPYKPPVQATKASGDSLTTSPTTFFVQNIHSVTSARDSRLLDGSEFSNQMPMIWAIFSCREVGATSQ